MITTMLAFCLLQATSPPEAVSTTASPQAAVATAAQDPAPPVRVEGGWVHVDFDPDAPPTLMEWIAAAQRILGDTYLVDVTAPQTLHVLETLQVVGYGAKRIAREDFETFFQSMLRIHGFVVVPSGAGPLEVGVIMMKTAQNSAEIRANSVFVSADEVASLSGQPATHAITVVRLQYVDAQDLGNNLRTILSSGPDPNDHRSFMALPLENAILVQGFGPFVASAVELIREFDVEPEAPRQPAGRPTEFRVYALQHCDAAELQPTIDVFLQRYNAAQGQSRAQRGRPEGQVVAVADVRTNSLLISSTPGQWAELKPILDALDRPVDAPSDD